MVAKGNMSISWNGKTGVDFKCSTVDAQQTQARSRIDISHLYPSSLHLLDNLVSVFCSISKRVVSELLK